MSDIQASKSRSCHAPTVHLYIYNDSFAARSFLVSVIQPQAHAATRCQGQTLVWDETKKDKSMGFVFCICSWNMANPRFPHPICFGRSILSSGSSNFVAIMPRPDTGCGCFLLVDCRCSGLLGSHTQEAFQAQGICCAYSVHNDQACSGLGTVWLRGNPPEEDPPTFMPSHPSCQK
jgi:hypothetical protein